MTNTLLIVIAILIFIMGSALICLACIYLGKALKNETELKRDIFMFSLPINDEENFNIIDNIIQHEIDVYQIYNFPTYVEDMYIKEADQQEMLKYILERVLKKISPVYMNKLKYIYNEDVLEDIVFEKVRDAVLNLTVEINGEMHQDKKNNGGV